MNAFLMYYKVWFSTKLLRQSTYGCFYLKKNLCLELEFENITLVCTEKSKYIDFYSFNVADNIISIVLYACISFV